MISLLPTIIPRRAGIVANTYITTRLKKGISVARKKSSVDQPDTRHNIHYQLRPLPRSRDRGVHNRPFISSGFSVQTGGRGATKDGVQLAISTNIPHAIRTQAPVCPVAQSKRRLCLAQYCQLHRQPRRDSPSSSSFLIVRKLPLLNDGGRGGKQVAILGVKLEALVREGLLSVCGFVQGRRQMASIAGCGRERGVRQRWQRCLSKVVACTDPTRANSSFYHSP